MKYFNNDLLNDIGKVSLEEVMLSEMEQARILKIAQKKMGTSIEKPSEPQKRRPRVLRTLAICAAIGCLLVTTAVAANLVLTMSPNAIPFLDDKNAAPQFNTLTSNLEQYNASVNMTVTDNGITAVLDTIAVDDNFINIFMTFTSDTDIDLDQYKREETDIANPLARFFARPHYEFYINDQLIQSSTVGQNDTTGVSMPDARTMKIMYHFAVGEDIPDVFTLRARSPFMTTPTGEEQCTIFNKTGRWDFTFEVDKTTTKAVTRKIAPQNLSFNTAKGVYTLGLRKLVSSPSGALAVYDYAMQPFTDEQGREGFKLPDGTIPLDWLAIKDDKGRWIYQIPTGSWGGRDFNVTELLGITADTTALTFIPLAGDEAAMAQDYEVGYVPLKEGERLTTSDAGGYDIVSVTPTDSGFQIALRPYGFNFTGPDVNFAVGGEKIPLHGWLDTTHDRVTGIVTYTQGGYTKKDIAKLKTATHVQFNKRQGVTLDEANAVTVKFE